jgi:hypothetical protein
MSKWRGKSSLREVKDSWFRVGKSLCNECPSLVGILEVEHEAVAKS